MLPRARRMTSRAFFSLMPAGASSRAVAVARDSMVWKPISCSFLLVAGPTPGRSSRILYFFSCGGEGVEDSDSIVWGSVSSSPCCVTVILNYCPLGVHAGTRRQFDVWHI